jgi:hypothetical protein
MMKAKLAVLVILIGIFISCAPINTSQPTLVPTDTPSSTPTIPPSKTPTPRIPTNTPTPQLSPVATQNGLPVFEINEFTVDHKYCNSPEVFLPKTDAQGLNDDKIAQKLMELWLDYFNTSQAPNYCRVNGYTIDKVYYNELIASYPLVPKGDFLRAIQFSVKLIQYPNFWIPLSGDIDKENRLHAEIYLAVFQASTGYTMKFARP